MREPKDGAEFYRRALRIVVSRIAVLAAISGLAAFPGSTETQTQQPHPANSPPSTLVLQGIVRDFKKKSESGGHADFENISVTGAGGVQRTPQG